MNRTRPKSLKNRRGQRLNYWRLTCPFCRRQDHHGAGQPNERPMVAAPGLSRAGFPGRPHRCTMAGCGKNVYGRVHLQGERQASDGMARDSSYYLRCEHSSATWSEDHPGEKLSAEFDEAMTKLLAPYARDGMLRFAVRTRIEWGHLRASEES